MAASHSTLQDWRLDISHLNHPYLPPAIRVCVPARYCVGSPLGAGAFGVVCAGTHLVSGGEVAIKQIRDPFEHPKQAKCFLREIVYQSRLDHPNVLRIKDLWLGLDGALYVCTDRMETDLGWVIKSPQPLTRDHVVYFIYQITLALKYLHAANIVHRDLKPGNCLVSGNCDLKICDFGMCRVIDQEPEQPEPLSEYVVTRWYRAPEIILCTQYDQSVDLWSLGCIMAQLIQRKPLFKGDSSRAQISAITAVTGVPANFLETVQMPDGARRFLQRTHNEHPTPPEVHWEDHIEVAQSYGAHLDPSASAALSATLQLDPSKRVSASHFLGLPFLAQLHDAGSELAPDKPLCSKWEKHVDYSDPSGPRTVVEMEMERLNPKTPETVRRRVVTLNEIEDALYTKGDLLPEPAGDALDPMELA